MLIAAFLFPIKYLHLLYGRRRSFRIRICCGSGGMLRSNFTLVNQQMNKYNISWWFWGHLAILALGRIFELWT